MKKAPPDVINNPLMWALSRAPGSMLNLPMVCAGIAWWMFVKRVDRYGPPCVSLVWNFDKIYWLLLNAGNKSFLNG